MKKTTPDIFLKYHKNPQTHILDKLASRECAPTDAKKWDRHTYIHSGLLDSTEVENFLQLKIFREKNFKEKDFLDEKKTYIWQ